MKHKTFKFDPDVWFKNRDLRSCSASARGFWVDLLALMHPSGYLAINGNPMDDKQIARLTGESVATVRKLIAELGTAGIFSVHESGCMFSSRMVKESKFVEQAKLSGARGQVKKKAKIQPEKQPSEKIGTTITVRVPKRQVISEETKQAVKLVADYIENNSVTTPPKPKKHVDWWKTNAGWARKGVEQAISIQTNEDVEDFKLRIALRLGDGNHIEGLTPKHQKRMKEQIKKEEKYMPNATDKS
jgi:hypothetical protein